MAHSIQSSNGQDQVGSGMVRKCTRSGQVWGWLLHLAMALIVTAGAAAGFAGQAPPVSAQSQTPDKPFIMPFADPAGPDTWLLAQPYGNTVGAFRQRNTIYSASGGIHFGVDFSAPCGTPIVAMADGVVFAVDNMRYGSAPHNLMLDHPALEYATFYGHLLEAPALKPGQKVQAGDVIALSGDPAETCYGRPHLHLEIRDLAHIRKYNPVLLVQGDWDNLALIGPFGQAFQYDLDQPRKWQHLDDQPEATAGGPLLNDFANPWPPDFPARPPAATSSEPATPDSTAPGQPASVPRLAHPLPNPSASGLLPLTMGGCCTQISWSPDASEVIYIDRPTLARPAGIWSANAAEPGPSRLFSDYVAYYTGDLAYRFVLQANTTIIERLSQPAGQTEQRWAVPANGRLVSLAPGRTRIAWQVSNEDLPVESRTAAIWVANLDGSQAQAIASIARGNILAWASDDVIVLSGRESRQAREQVLWALSLADGSRIELARSERLRGGTLSPDGAWLAHYVALSETRAENGLWLVRTDGTQRRPLGRELFGAYKWRDANRLLVVPFQPEVTASHAVWQYEVRDGDVRQLTDPATTPFKIANNDWAVSPDGSRLAFVESRDDNIWLLTLPD